MLQDNLDKRIAAAVQADEMDVPPQLAADLRRRIAGVRRRDPAWGWPQVWAALAAMAMLAFFILVPLFQAGPPPEKKISQIRTELTLPEKNIKIVWVQRDDFRMGGYGE